ncbi:MAG: sigma-54 dependent transcriptional regulator [Candidatus Lernaella stagnicola]|nr:sigma-54 dependent transcriptional regulator [Candidatus Lernaella stagnicola]
MTIAAAPSAKILLVDPKPERRDELAASLAGKGFEIGAAGTGSDGLERFREGPYDLVITGIQDDELDGLVLLREVRAIVPSTMGVVISRDSSPEEALEAMKWGAFDYVTEPYNFEELLIIVHRALQHQRLLTENVSLKDQLRQKYRFESIVGDSRPMHEVFRLIEKVADSDSTVLVCGESGTGKELVARALHYNSKRKQRYLIPVNCGAIPETLLESELFGHVRGAFTGATTNRIGRFEAANGGTLFLDEIGDMSPVLQIKLLRVLQEHEFEPVGSTKSRKVDVRIIAATNRNLDEMVETGEFREDLYYRLSVIPLVIPPLRDRRDDIPLLINHFIDVFCRQKKRPPFVVSPDVSEVFLRYDWPGNVRELENLVERLVILTEGDRITLEDLPEKYLNGRVAVIGDSLEIPDDGIDFNAMVNDYENKLIAAAMIKARGNKNAAARLLGLKRTTLVEKIKKKGLSFE